MGTSTLVNIPSCSACPSLPPARHPQPGLLVALGNMSGSSPLGYLRASRRICRRIQGLYGFDGGSETGAVIVKSGGGMTYSRLRHVETQTRHLVTSSLIGPRSSREMTEIVGVGGQRRESSRADFLVAFPVLVEDVIA